MFYAWMVGERLTLCSLVQQEGNIQASFSIDKTLASTGNTDQGDIAAIVFTQQALFAYEQFGQALAYDPKSKQSKTKLCHRICPPNANPIDPFEGTALATYIQDNFRRTSTRLIGPSSSIPIRRATRM